MGRQTGSGLRAVLLLPVVAVMAFTAGSVAPATAGATASGPSWIPTQAAVPSGAATATKAEVHIEATACPSPGFCMAVGSYRTTAGTKTYAPVVELYSAGTWTGVTVPLPANAGTGSHENGYLNSVSCAGPASCTAVGQDEGTTGHDYGLIDALSGTTWTATQAPEPSGAGTGTLQDTYLASVACPAPGSCIATGFYENATGGTTALIDSLSGGTWTATTGPVPSGAGTGTKATVTLTSVSCLASGSCTAVGGYDDATGHEHGLIESLSSGTWTATEAPEPSGAGAGTNQYAHLGSVSCPASGSCTAVGDYEDATGHDHGLIDALSGTTWTATEAPEPAGAGTGTKQHAYLGSVSCPASGSCTAVGYYQDATGHDHGLIDVLSGTAWAATEAPEPSGAGTGTNQYADLGSVSCPASGSCTAVGTYEDATVHDHGLIDALSGTTWTATQAPEPAGAGTGTKQSASLVSVACTAGGCAAGGSYKDTAGGTYGLLETYNMTPSGYFEAASDGGIFAFTVPFHGSMGGQHLNAPIVAAAADPLTGGYYEVAADGGIFAFTAPFHGSMGGKPLNEPIVGMAFDTRTGGYYEVAADGGIFAFTAPFHGSMGGKPLNEPIVGMAFDPATGGYWEVASDGGIFAFTAPFEGSMGGKQLNKPIVGMAYDSLTNGYYEVASDGGIFAFTAPFEGSMGGKQLNEPVVGMAFDYGTGGYWEVASDGGLFAFTAPFLGSMGGKPLNEPIVGMALG